MAGDTTFLSAPVAETASRDSSRGLPCHRTQDRRSPRDGGSPGVHPCGFCACCRSSTRRADVERLRLKPSVGEDTQVSRCKYAMTASRGSRRDRARRRAVPRDTRHPRENLREGANRRAHDRQSYPVPRTSIDSGD